MAKRPYFHIINNQVVTSDIDFVFIKGMSFSQKQKCVLSMHKSIVEFNKELKPLEVSSKSLDEIGKKLSAFNMKLDGFYVESIFQSSKVFSNGVSLNEYLNEEPSKAKKAASNIFGSNIIKFSYKGIDYPINPKTCFYDWIYINSLKRMNVDNEITKYNCFTDIEFNPKHSINCQAKACCIYLWLYKNRLIDKALSSFNNFVDIVYKNMKEDPIQVQMNLDF